MNAPKTFALLAALLALAVGTTACGTGGDTTASETDSSTSTGQSAEAGSSTSASGGEDKEAVPTIVVENGEPVDGITKLEYNAGDQIRFDVEGDEAEEIHVHGYDLMEDIPQGGGTVEFNFPAEIEGIFEAELEGKGVQILELRVNP